MAKAVPVRVRPSAPYAVRNNRGLSPVFLFFPSTRHGSVPADAGPPWPAPFGRRWRGVGFRSRRKPSSPAFGTSTKRKNRGFAPVFSFQGRGTSGEVRGGGNRCFVPRSIRRVRSRSSAPKSHPRDPAGLNATMSRSTKRPHPDVSQTANSPFASSGRPNTGKTPVFSVSVSGKSSGGSRQNRATGPIPDESIKVLFYQSYSLRIWTRFILCNDKNR